MSAPSGSPDPAPSAGGRYAATRAALMQGTRRRLKRARLRLLAAGRWLRRQWRSSLHMRVISVTVVLGLALTLLLGSFTYQRIADGLVSERISTATEEAAQATRSAQSLFDSADRTDQNNLNVVSWDTVQAVASAGDDDSRQVVLARALSNDRTATVSTLASDTGIGLVDVPRELREALDEDSNHQQVMLVPMPGTGAADPVPAVLIGARVQIPRAGPHDLYFFFPMEREQETLLVVQRTFVGAAVMLAVLVGAIAYVVTRLVVTPVRSAAHVSERLAHGELNERMEVRGEDDLARLATSFNQMADSLQAQIRQLEELSRVQHRFVSDVSHELRTPLTTIRMAGEILYSYREDFQAPVARSAELLHEELDRFESLLTDLLEISRFDAGAAVLELEPTDIRDVVEQVVQGARRLAERQGSVLTVSAPAESCEVDMDSRRVARILRNLVGNAIEHGEGRPIDITVAGNTSAVAVSVRDHGIGLPDGQEDQVFQRFWRADPARTRSTGGTGLGLAIAQEDAHLHHGWLQASGERGVGACFRLILPRREGSIIEEPPPVPQSAALDAVCPVEAVPLSGQDGPSPTSGPVPDHGGKDEPPDNRSRGPRSGQQTVAEPEGQAATGTAHQNARVSTGGGA